MNASVNRLTKLSAPKLFSAVARRRLFERLDALKDHPALWISGPAGCGKTTLVATYCESRDLRALWYQIDAHDGDAAEFFHYLALGAAKALGRDTLPFSQPVPDSRDDLQGFARRFFRELYAELRAPFVLVFDNYQEAEESAALDQAMQEALLQVPDGIRIILVSRSLTPASLSRLRATRMLVSLGWHDLRLTLDEAREIAGAALPDDAVAAIHERCDGWVAGLVLAIANLQCDQQLPDGLGGDAKDEAFSLFAGLLFGNVPAAMRQMLLRTALLPRMTEEMAQTMSGNPNAGQLLESLYRKQLFTSRKGDGIYQYHNLLRDFLVDRARKECSAEEWRSIAHSSGELLLANGNIEDAFGCFAAAEDWDSATRLILTHASDWVAQGRGRTVRGWIARLPEACLDADPWLSYWNGVAGIEFDPEQSSRELRRAFDRFESTGERRGALLAWSWIARAVSLNWGDRSRLDKWIAWLDDELKANPVFPDADTEIRVVSSMAHALLVRRPDRLDLPDWMDRAFAGALQSEDTKFAVMTAFSVARFNYLMGEPAKARIVTQWCSTKAADPKATPVVRIIAQVLEAFAHFGDGNLQLGLETVEQALEQADTSGVRMLNHHLRAIAVHGCLALGETARARRWLQAMHAGATPEKSIRFAEFHYLSAGLALQSNELSYALEHMKLAFHAGERAGSIRTEALHRFGLAQILHQRGDVSALEQELDKAHRAAIGCRSVTVQVAWLLLKAQTDFDRGDTPAALEHLRNAFTRAASVGLGTVLWWWRPKLLADLCVRALDARIEIAYVSRLIQSMRLVPSEPPFACEHWPWPIRIETLGTFNVVREGRSLSASGKAQQKPLELLSALISFGGQGVAAAALAEKLWPQSDGDSAHSTFDVTLHRLRKMLGAESAIALSEGRLSLDPYTVWVDAQAFERIADKARDALRLAAPVKENFDSLAESAFALYRGHFLEHEEEQPWMLGMRERLRHRFRRLVDRLGLSLENSGQWDRAERLYRRGLELDFLAEDFYQRLMVCHCEQGRPAEALEVYRRCRHMFSVVLGVAPSKKTESLFLSLQKA